MDSNQLQPFVHARGQVIQLDRVFDLVRFAAHPRPLTECLDALPRQIAGVFDAAVCSIYLREGDHLVMRGNVGFPEVALSDVRLSIGEGITGIAVEYMRPISLSVARDHAHYRHFPLLGEERFPVFLAVPLPGPQGPIGALVLQRRDLPPFSDSEIQLAVALTAPICAAVDRSKLVDVIAEKRSAEGAARRVTLPGRSIVRGRALGRALAPRRPNSPDEASAGVAQQALEPKHALERATARARRLLERQQRKARDDQPTSALLAMFGSMLDDARLRERALEICKEQGAPLARALATAGGEAARAAARSGDDYTIRRARFLADLCETLSFLAYHDGPAVPRGTVLLADQMTVFELLVARPSALVLTGELSHPDDTTLALLLGVPTVSEVHELYRWVSDGDTLIVDAHHGLLRVNPSRAEISALREQQRQDAPEQESMDFAR